MSYSKGKYQRLLNQITNDSVEAEFMAARFYDPERAAIVKDKMIQIQGMIQSLRNMEKTAQEVAKEAVTKTFGSPSSWAMSEMDDEEWMNEGKDNNE